MQKQGFYINNPSSEFIGVIELSLSIPPGISNLFELNPDLTYEQIDHSIKRGTLCAAIDNGLCYPVPGPLVQNTFSSDILIRKPLQVQILPSRARFTSVKNPDATVFSGQEDIDLFHEQEIKPAREIEEEIKSTPANLDKIEATIKQANIPEKPFESRYVIPPVKPEEAQKIKNDIAMGYVTCEGMTADGKRCMRQAKTGKKFCGLHKKQAK